MKPTRSVTTWCACLSLLLLCGCVHPGNVDVDNIHRLQQAILRRHPQHRGNTDLAPMMPQGAVLPDLPVAAGEGEKKDDGKSYVKLDLQQAVARTLANNTDIAIVSYTPEINREQMVQAAAQFDYILFGSLSHTTEDSARNDKNTTTLFPTGQPNDKTNTLEMGVRKRSITGTNVELTSTFTRTWDDQTTDSEGRWYQRSLELSVTQPLLRDAWPEVNLAQLRIARLDHKIGMSEFRGRVEEVIVQVMSAYYQLQQAKTEVEIAERLLKRTIETRDLIIERGELDANKVEISQTKAAVKVRESVLVQAKKNYRDIQDQLLRLIGNEQFNLMGEFEIVPTTLMSDLPVEIDEADQLLTALRLNPTLEQARLAIQQQDINVRVARWQQLPELNFGATADLNGASRSSRSEAWEDIENANYSNYSVALTFEYPIGNRERRAFYRQNKLQRQLAITQMQNAADVVAQQIRERIRQVKTTYEQLQIQRQAVQENINYLTALEDRSKMQKLDPNFLNLRLNAQAAVAESERAVISAQVQYNVALLDLARVTGAVLEMNQVKLAMPIVAEPVHVDVQFLDPMPREQQPPVDTVPPADQSNVDVEPADSPAPATADE